MSSYFDKASRMFTDAMKNRTEAEAEKIVETVVNTYGTYLTFISKRLSVASRPAFEPLKERWLKLISRPLVDDRDRDMFLSLLIERIHDFAHAVGSASLKRRDGRPFLDNPYVVKTDIIMEAMRP